MKTVIGLLVLISGLTASASSFQEYDYHAQRLLTDVVSLCPNEIVEALQVGVVSEASRVGGMTPEGLREDIVLTISSSPSPLIPKQRELATLKIIRVASKLMPADGGPRYQTTCELTKNY